MIVIGTIFGSIFGGIQSQMFGRKITMLSAIGLFISGMSCIRFGSHYAFLLFGQFLMGFSSSYLACAVPSYNSEISQPQMRKLSGTFYTTFFSLGGALMFLFTAIFHIRTSMIIVLVMASSNFILMLFCPKSPSWLLNKGRQQDAFEVLKRIRGCEEVARVELDRLKENKKKQALSMEKSGEENKKVERILNSVKQSSFLKPLFVLMSIFLFGLQLSGATSLPIYFIPFLNKTGVVTVFDPYWAASTLTLWRVCVNVMATLVASRVKRRPLLIFAGLFCAIGWFMTGLSTYFYENDYFVDYISILPWFTYISFGVTITGYASGFVMVLFMLLGELLPSNLRGLGIGIVLSFNNTAWFLMVFLFPKILSTFGTGGTFFAMSGMTFFVIILIYFIVPETLGRTLENIESHYRKEKDVDENEIL